MQLLQRRPNHDDLDIDDENDAIDPELRLRTVRTAHSTLEESIRTEERARRRRSLLHKRSMKFFRRDKKRSGKADSVKSTPEAAAGEHAAAPPITGLRRNIYVNMPLPPDELDKRSEPLVRYVRNKVRTSSEYLPPCSVPRVRKSVWLIPPARIHISHIRSQKPV